MAKKNRDKDLLEVMRNASFMLDIGRVVVTAVMNKGGKIAQLRRLLTDAARMERIADIVIADDLAQVGVQAFVQPPPPSKPVQPTPTFTNHELAMDYAKTIEEMLKAGGYDGYVNPNVTTTNYPVTGSGVAKLTATLVHFGRRMTDAEVDEWCEANGYRRATALEILTFGAAYKQLQRQFPIVSGQSALLVDFRRVVCLGGGGVWRYVDLFWSGGGWLDVCRFLVLPK